MHKRFHAPWTWSAAPYACAARLAISRASMDRSPRAEETVVRGTHTGHALKDKAAPGSRIIFPSFRDYLLYPR